MLSGMAGFACGPRTPEDALERLSRAVEAEDAVALFQVLDKPTQWAWMTVVRCHREGYDIVMSTFPEGPDRARALRHFEPGVQAASPAELFARESGAAALAKLKVALPHTGAIERNNDTASVRSRDPEAPPLVFRAVEGRWGYAGFDSEAQDRQKRALADLELIKENALDYERAAKRVAP